MEDMRDIDEDEDYDDEALKVEATEDMSMMDNLIIEGYLMMQGIVDESACRPFDYAYMSL